jgi:nucleotidyltransferase/DNA polymerase involved in DNA repair
VDGTISPLTSLPGIGPARAKALSDAGIETVSDLGSASIEKIAGIRGVTLDQARCLLDFARELAETTELVPDEPDPTAPPSVEFWHEKTTRIRSQCQTSADYLLAHTHELNLRPGLVRQIRATTETMCHLNPESAPPDDDQKNRILKHARALCMLIESVGRVEIAGKYHQQVLRDRIRYHRRKLTRWLDQKT